jgi:hypothetical protein
MLKVRACGALIAVVLVTLAVSSYLEQYWVRAFAEGSELTGDWLSPRWLEMTWGWGILVALFAGLALAAMLPRGSSILWYIGLGVLFALVRLFVQGSLRASDAGVAFAVWWYGSYVVSVVGATLGGAIALAAGAWRRRLTNVGGGRETR